MIRTLPGRPRLDQLKRQAKELLAAYRAGDAEAAADVRARFGPANPATFALHHAQLVLARTYGFDSWPRLKAYVDGVTVSRLADAVRAGDVARVRRMLDARPELVHMDMAESDEHRALHYAVLERAPEMVRLLMARGADARKGIYPYRDATSAFAIATDRGYDEIVATIVDEEQKRSAPVVLGPGAPASTVAKTSSADRAVARGDLAWLRARHDEGTLASPAAIDIFAPATGLLTLAVQHDRPDVLALLLDLGFDPDERMRLQNLEAAEYSWGMPLWHCAALKRYAMAETLLTRGADPNGRVYASGSPVFRAYMEGDREMIALLQRHGGVADAITVAKYGETMLAKEMLAGERDSPLQEGIFAGRPVAEQLLWGAADGGYPEIVRMALVHVDWPRDDPRWYRILWRPFPGRAVRQDFARYLECLRLILERGDPSVRGTFGRTLLHDIVVRGRPDEQVAYATLLLDTGARVDVRDDLLKSTPLGWACRWGRVELVRLLLARGADPVEADAEPWATPRAWATRRGHREVVALLE